ncbi:MAG TPA: hypothetical protein VF070_27630 [Streptosporangiaceae bacterium]
MDLAAMSAGILIGAAVASLAVFGWAASQLRWLAAHSRQQIAYWRSQAEQAETAAAWLRDNHTVGGCNRPGPVSR